MVDLAIIGAGPAGAALACALAGRWDVVLIDRDPVPRARIGEALVPAAGRLLRDLGLGPAFHALAPAAYMGNRSQWGSETIEYRDFIADPDGPGWHLDRAAFEQMLREEAARRGATCLFGHKLVRLDGQELHLTGGKTVTARIQVDASGRAAVLARRKGARRCPDDDMTARWCFLDHPADSTPTGISSVIAVPGGWWYHAAGARHETVRVSLVFHAPAGNAPKWDALAMLDAARAVPALRDSLEGATPSSPATTTAAHTARLDRVSGPDWLAIGDAGLSVDPIASRGLFHSLYTAYVGAALIDDILCGHAQDFALYDADITKIHTHFRTHAQALYTTEPRWPQDPFWHRFTA